MDYLAESLVLDTDQLVRIGEPAKGLLPTRLVSSYSSSFLRGISTSKYPPVSIVFMWTAQLGTNSHSCTAASYRR